MEGVTFVLGILIGLLLYYVFGKRKKISGTFVIDTTDAMKDICRFEMDESLNSIYLKKQIILKVRVIEDNSHD